ncbi:MAG: envelope integrity protein Cei [Thermocrispum sp.]
MPSEFSGRETRPYRRYRPLPALIMIAVLGGASAIIWLKVLNASGDVDEAIRCNPPASPPPGMTYTAVPHDALDEVDPIPPDQVDVRVLNASGKRRQAALVSESLKQLGFSEIGRPANDKAYENRDKPGCRGQIRFGANGEAAARTLSLVDSCVELIKDGRKDASVDLAIGAEFTDVRPRREAVTALEVLAKWSDKYGSRSSELSAGKQAPQLSDDLLEAARTDSC